jgi:hypothetical protein
MPDSINTAEVQWDKPTDNKIDVNAIKWDKPKDTPVNDELVTKPAIPPQEKPLSFFDLTFSLNKSECCSPK